MVLTYRLIDVHQLLLRIFKYVGTVLRGRGWGPTITVATVRVPGDYSGGGHLTVADINTVTRVCNNHLTGIHQA